MPNLARCLSVAALVVPCACGATPTAAPASGSPRPPPAASTSSPPALQEATPALRLPADTSPTSQAVTLTIDPNADRFTGVVDIDVVLQKPRSVVWLNGKGLHVTRVTAKPTVGAAVAGDWKQETEGGVASITFHDALAAGAVRLHVEYDAPFSTKYDGLYKVTRDNVAYVYTQFEPIDARKALPCFDEPGRKIPFETTLIVPSGLDAVANSRELERVAEGARTRVRFAKTLPLPSYLVAFAVGPFDFVAAPPLPPNAVRSRELPVRVVTARGSGSMAAYAAAHAGEILALEEQLFGSEYPYDKLDLIAVIDAPGRFGAMENAGAITFAERALLFDGASAPLARRRSYAWSLAHELAHQWVGDLVTASFWDDIWLNEAFATWIAPKIVDRWDPSMAAHDDMVADANDVMALDSLASTRAIRQPIASLDDIPNAFDGITYEKGAAVLGMFEKWVGSEKFMDGLHAYLGAHRFGNATADDFLDAESRVAGRDVKTPFRTFLDRRGIPFVESSVLCDGHPRLHVSQHPYVPIGGAPADPVRWQIPICAEYPSGEGLARSCTLLTEDEGDLPLGESCPSWVMPNAGGAGYYRFGLAPADLARVSKSGVAKLSVAERIAYAESLRASYDRAGNTTSFESVMGGAASLANDARWDVASLAATLLYASRDALYDEAATRKAIESEARRLYAPVAKGLGWTVAKGEPAPTTDRREAVLRFLALRANDAATRKEAKRRGLAYLGEGRDGQLHPGAVDRSLVRTCMTVLGQEADRRLWDAVKARLAQTSDPDVRGTLLALLVAAQSPELRRAALDLALDPVLRPAEAYVPLARALHDRETRADAWRWEQANYDKLAAVVPDASNLIPLNDPLCDDASADEVQRFYAGDRIAHLPGAPRLLDTTVEQIRLCAARRKAHDAGERAFFGKAPATPKAPASRSAH